MPPLAGDRLIYSDRKINVDHFVGIVHAEILAWVFFVFIADVLLADVIGKIMIFEVVSECVSIAAVLFRLNTDL